jgi:tRNA(fMet)-specific endonuclease VapC
MTIGPTDLILLDTNVLVHWVRQDRTGRHILQVYDLGTRNERPLFSTITEGEILGLAKCWNWGNAKLQALEDILAELVRFEASLPEVVYAYAELYQQDQAIGRNTGENDLWIAACARASRSILLTCDQDFLWLNPTWIKVEYVAKIP